MPHSTRGNLKDLTQEAKQSLISNERLERKKASHDAGSKPFMLPNHSFVETIATLIEWARYQNGAAIIERNIASIRCARQWPSAFIEFNGRDGLVIEQEYRQPPPDPDRPNRLRFTWWQLDSLRLPAPIMVDASIPGIIFPCLADLCGFVDEKSIELEKIQIPNI
jgi:hypothetical protein